MDPTDQKIRKQVAYYFSDINLPFDRFLYNETRKNKGWIALQTIASFKRMQMICSDFDKVLAALKAEPLDDLEINDRNQIRRKSKLVKQNFFYRTVYVDGLDDYENVEGQFQLLDDLEETFGQFGKVIGIRLRKEDEKPYKFKNSAYVTFDEEKQAVEAAKKQQVEFRGKNINVMTKKQFKQKEDPDRQKQKKKNIFNAFELEKESALHYKDISRSDAEETAKNAKGKIFAVFEKSENEGYVFVRGKLDLKALGNNMKRSNAEQYKEACELRKQRSLKRKAEKDEEENDADKKVKLDGEPEAVKAENPAEDAAPQEKASEPVQADAPAPETVKQE
ncbi:hypothetical protein BCR43DRAFT_497524 [Syncephalastrum racemosum]|uniref:Uncharacterized protein n=1 Tax=Syncephalastrum racemosum TaxID=13706 RepID=A0A1X2H2G4_SYNRA|nr:hypothetical protein BCR43DRAFT_497524 [Syncephalastrum racemosum]